MGTYPSYSFTPDDDAIIIWAAGQIYYVPLTINGEGEKVSSGSPKPIKFTAHIEKRLANTVTGYTDLRHLEIAKTQKVYAFTDLRVNSDGSKVVFQGPGVTYVHSVGHEKTSKPKRIPTVHANVPYYSPSFVPGTSDLVIQARWSDTNFSTFEFTNLTSGSAYEIDGLSLGRYFAPTVSGGHDDERLIAFIKTSGDYMTGDIVATAGAGLYVGSLVLPSGSSLGPKKLSIKDVKFIASSPSYDDPAKTKIRWLGSNEKILVEQTQDAYTIDLSAGPDENGRFTEVPVISGESSTELAISPNGAIGGKPVDVAFVDFYHVYFAPSVSADTPVWSKPGNASEKTARLSVDGGHDLAWSGDGKTLFWFLGKSHLCLTSGSTNYFLQ